MAPDFIQRLKASA